MNLPKEYYDKSPNAQYEWLKLEMEKCIEHADFLEATFIELINKHRKDIYELKDAEDSEIQSIINNEEQYVTPEAFVAAAIKAFTPFKKLIERYPNVITMRRNEGEYGLDISLDALEPLLKKGGADVNEG